MLRTVFLGSRTKVRLHTHCRSRSQLLWRGYSYKHVSDGSCSYQHGFKTLCRNAALDISNFLLSEQGFFQSNNFRPRFFPKQYFLVHLFSKQIWMGLNDIALFPELLWKKSGNPCGHAYVKMHANRLRVHDFCSKRDFPSQWVSFLVIIANR